MKHRTSYTGLYPTPIDDVNGAGRDLRNLGYWAERAHKNSAIAPRAKEGPMRLPNTGKMQLRSTNAPPVRNRAIDEAMVDSGPGYMSHLRD